MNKIQRQLLLQVNMRNPLSSMTKHPPQTLSYTLRCVIFPSTRQVLTLCAAHGRPAAAAGAAASHHLSPLFSAWKSITNVQIDILQRELLGVENELADVSQIINRESEHPELIVRAMEPQVWQQHELWLLQPHCCCLWLWWWLWWWWW
jgi:hypothetical protein